MIELFISAFITFFVVIDPPGCAPIYASLTSKAPPRDRRNMAIRAIFVAAIILLVFALFGEQMLGALGISLDSFRIAGGVMLFLIALEMVFEKRTERREDRAQEIIGDPEIAVMLLTSQNDGIDNALVILGALGAVLLLTLFGLLAAGPLMRILGNKVEAVITRVLGVLLGALAVQFVVDGLNASF